jgi:hypothetical protein
LIEHLEERARFARCIQPQGYLHWLQYLQQEANWPALREASGEALASLMKGRERGKAAEFLITAGGKPGEEPTVLSGYREKFRSTVNERSLLHLVNEAERQQQRACELEEVCSFLGEQLHEYCRALYNRLIAFRREARATVGKSAILRGMANGL